MKKKGSYIISIIAVILLILLYSWIDLNYSPIDIRSSQVRVIDGDSIVINKQRIRLKGIDTPELKQQCYNNNLKRSEPCGTYAKMKLRTLIGSNVVSCSYKGVDRYNRHLAYCYVKDKNLNIEVVKQGYAVTYMNNNLLLELHKAIAQTKKQGIWSTNFKLPSGWRKQNKENKQSKKLLLKK